VQRDPKGGLLALVTGSGATGEYYYVLDGQSNVIGLVDAAGTERARYTYDPYGADDTAVAVNGTLPDNPYRYASGRAVATNAANQVVLYQYGQRFYQRSIGRWTQQDNLEHLGDPTQGNRYTYAGCDPVNRVDPDGTNALSDFFTMNCTVLAIEQTVVFAADAVNTYLIFRRRRDGSAPSLTSLRSPAERLVRCWPRGSSLHAKRTTAREER